MVAIIFYIFAFCAVGAAFMSAINRHPFYRCLWLSACTLFVAGLCIIAGAGFVAFVYMFLFGAGFGIMMLGAAFFARRSTESGVNGQWIPAVLLTVGITIGMIFLMIRSFPARPVPYAGAHPSLVELARAVFVDYALPLGVLFVVFIMTLAGAVTVLRKLRSS